MLFNRIALIFLLGGVSLGLFLFGVDPLLVLIIVGIFMTMFILLESIAVAIINLSNKEIKRKSTLYSRKIQSIKSKIDKKFLV